FVTPAISAPKGFASLDSSAPSPSVCRDLAHIPTPVLSVSRPGKAMNVWTATFLNCRASGSERAYECVQTLMMRSKGCFWPRG
ncbi:hypothetical protein CH063_10872, partial [Colletotrichum higginsianum]